MMDNDNKTGEESSAHPEKSDLSEREVEDAELATIQVLTNHFRTQPSSDLDALGLEMNKKVTRTPPEAEENLEIYILQHSSGKGTVDEIIEETGQKKRDVTKETEGSVPTTSSEPEADWSSDSDVVFIRKVTAEERLKDNCNQQKMQLDSEHSDSRYLLLFSSGVVEEIVKGEDNVYIKAHTKEAAARVEEIIKEKTGLDKGSLGATTAETLRPTSLIKPNSSAHSDVDTFEEVIGEESRGSHSDRRNQKMYVFIEVMQKRKGDTTVAEGQKVKPGTSKDADSSDSEVIYIGEKARGGRLVKAKPKQRPVVIDLTIDDDSSSPGWEGLVGKRHWKPETDTATDKKPRMSGDGSGSREMNTKDDSRESSFSSAPSSPLTELEPINSSFEGFFQGNEYDTDSSDIVEYVRPPVAISPPAVYTPSPSSSGYSPEPQHMIEFMNDMDGQVAQNLGRSINDTADQSGSDTSDDPGNDSPDN